MSNHTKTIQLTEVGLLKFFLMTLSLSKFFMKALVGSIVFVLILRVSLIFVPMPFIRPLWYTNILSIRGSMTESVSYRITGLSKDEVISKLGFPTLRSFNPGPGDMVISYHISGWRHFVISFDDYGIVRGSWIGNPAHVGLGG
ncbi:MAG: hypothetical protein FWF80_06140 [Defluviitaleaceae bacterium]|nr:hypothetical protein [Defluviitaleaceae bacterium]